MPAERSPDEWLDELCDRLSSGEGIHEITDDAHMPHETTVYKHMAKNQEVARRIAHARAAQQDYEADQCVKMADTANSENWQVVKLRIWARQWRASKLAPKKYGDKLALGGDQDNPINVATTIRREVVDSSDPDTDGESVSPASEAEEV